MSACISQRGEFSSHEPDAEHVCTFCGVLDEDALIDELRRVRESVASLTADNERLRALTATCSCGTSPMTYEGPEADCVVHGAVRAFNEAQAELSSLRELESAARAWAGKFEPMAGRPLDPDYYSAEEIALVAAVDALPPTPPATEGSE